MKAVMAFSSRAASGARTAFAGMGQSGGQTVGAGDPFTGKELGGMSRGLSVLGSLSEFAGGLQKAKGMDDQARDEWMAGRQEYIQASEKVSAIDAEFNQLVGQQLVASSAMGIDAGSGSVIAARNAAQADADRERKIIRNSAEANARLRNARSTMLREAAKTTRFGATLKMGMDVARAFL